MRRAALQLLLVALAAGAASSRVLPLRDAYPSPMMMPPAPSLAEHPRVWLTSERLSRLRREAARGSERWRALVRAADAALEARDSDTTAVPALALTGLVAGEPRYCERVAETLAATAVAANRLDGDSYYSVRFVLPDIAAGLDWCHHELSPAVRTQVATWLMDRADEVWPETNPARVGGWGVDAPANNYYWGFLMTWPAALAAAGDDRASVGEVDRPAEHLQLALHRWTTEAVPMLTGWGAGGVFPESTNYDAMLSLGRILDAHFTATGVNLADVPGMTFVADSLLWRVHSTVPTRDAYYPLGDQPRVSWGELSGYDRIRALTAQALTADRRRRGLAQAWLQSIEPPATSWPWLVAWEFLYFDPEVPPTALSGMPTAFLAEGPGLLVRRSDWSTSATYFGFWAGPLRESHQSRDVNGFKIWKGGWLAGDASIWSHSGILQDTRFHNNLTVDADGQFEQVPDERWPLEAGRLLHVDSTLEYTYVSGQAAQAYVVDRPHGGMSRVEDYTRGLVYLAVADAFVVVDRVLTESDEAEVQWHLHARGPVRLSGSRFDFGHEGAHLWADTLLPRNAELSVAEIHEGPNAELTSRRVDLLLPRSNRRRTTVNVLQLTASAAHAPPPARLLESDGDLVAVLVGAWAVVVGNLNDGLASGTWVSPPAVSAQLVVGFQPSHTYEFKAHDASGQLLWSGQEAASVAGTLRLAGQPGGARWVFEDLGPATGTLGALPDADRIIR